MNVTYRTARGRPTPIGASAGSEGINFALVSRHANTVSLVLFPLHGDDTPMAEIPLDYHINRTGRHWHITVMDLPNAFRYGWRVDGPAGPTHRFHPEHVLMDPAAHLVSDGDVWGGQTHRFQGPWTANRGSHRKSVYVGRRFDWRQDSPLNVPMADTILYELHVRAFTCDSSSGVPHAGTFAGLREKIPYLKELGVTAVELLPVHEFDEDDCPFSNPFTGERLRNLWGYNSIAFAAPKAAYAASAPDHGQLLEFREMVRAFHEAGIEVILDVVFNHTGEGDDRGPTYSFRGLDNDLYYMLSPEGKYLNFSGCGNTVNCNHPVVRNMIVNCLRFWIADMHIDGLRFDLASVFGRDSKGNVMLEPPIVEMIAEDGVLADTKLIAEPWDAGGLYQVGDFPCGQRWSEWNGKFRDDVRKFWRGDLGTVGDFATRICGSADLYEKAGRAPWHSINFITCHDGFTLCDLVSYNNKHNEANGEANRDGMNDNNSWNCGVEGPTTHRGVLNLRLRQAKNLMATLFLAQGTPMMLAGDEFLRTQKGNNNAWCQDNELSWVDWNLTQKNPGFLRFTQMLTKLRKRHPALRRTTFFRGSGPNNEFPADIIWHGPEAFEPDFSYNSLVLAFCLNGQQTGREPDRDIYVACNAWGEAILFRIPPAPNGRRWRRVIDTAQPSPIDIVDIDEGPIEPAGSLYPVTSHSLLMLVSEEL